jgi:polar amino acid transport system permease protein
MPGALLSLLPPMVDGLVVTIQLTAGAAGVALTFAFVAGLLRGSKRGLLRAVALGYVELFRGTSALIQLFWAYFVLPLFGVPIDALTAGIWVLGLNAGAYGAEIVRGAVAAVPAEQREGGAVLGFSERQVLARIILPQALPRMLPPLNNLMIELLKNTALASMITLSDLTFEAQALRAATLRTAEIFGLLLALYFALSLVITACFRALEHRTRALLGETGARP